MLESENDAVLLGRRNACEYSCLFHHMLQGGVGHSLDFIAQNDAGRVDADLFANMAGDELVIAGYDFELNAILPEAATVLAVSGRGGSANAKYPANTSYDSSSAE